VKYRLKDRNRPLPNGVSVFDAGTGYRAPQHASFTAQAAGVLQARMGNPDLCQRYGLRTDLVSCEQFVEEYLGRVAFDNGWQDFYTTDREGGAGSGAVPFPVQGSAGGRARALVAGARVLIDWIAGGAEAVPVEQANRRASVCAACPLNSKEELTAWFTRPVSAAIQSALEERKGMSLSTPFDDKLGVCAACLCPMGLKVHVELEKFLPKMSQETKARLDPACWILAEEKAR
jgi:hypothetical protein